MTSRQEAIDNQSPAARRKMIEERQKRSLAWRIIHLLGSLQLALLLLAIIAIACAAATFAESSFNTKIAQAYIYKAPWFILWLAVLCINLFAVTLTRWPWQRKHFGFIITHYGIIILLIGAVVGQKAGFEGNVTLQKGDAPLSRVTTSRSILQIENPNDMALYILPFDAEVTRPSEKRPRSFEVPGTSYRIVADAFSDRLIRETRLITETAQGLPSALLRLDSTMSQNTLTVPLQPGTAQASFDLFSLAEIRAEAAGTATPEGAEPIEETQMIFAKFAPVADNRSGRTEVLVTLSEDGSKITVTPPGDVSATFRLQEALGKPLQVGAAKVTVREYFPDFVIQDGRPSTASDQPNNPAALVQIEAVKLAEAAAQKPTLILRPSSDPAKWDYRLERNGSVQSRGQLQVGDKIATGWADWQLEVLDLQSKAGVVEEVVEVEEKSDKTIPGFRAHLVKADGTPGPSRWVESGRVTALTDGETVVRVGYGLELRPVPFSIQLEKFEVPRYEGTETPANFIATVQFRDSATGETKTDTAQMNKPASFPGGWWAQLSGFNYKFSQAEWNPQDLNQTTLQVLYDPGWMLKWIGSLGICLGVFILFYLKPKSR